MATPAAQPQPKGSGERVADGGDTFQPSQSVPEEDLCPTESVPAAQGGASDPGLLLLKSFPQYLHEPFPSFSVLMCRETNAKHLPVE